MKCFGIVPSVLILFLAVVVQPALVYSADNELSPAEKKAGWKLLFDGKSTSQWRNYRKDGISEGWQIVDGALTRAKGGAGDIITKEKYGEFELSIEYKISKGGNSGIMFHCTEEENAPWQTGPEIQIQDNVDGHDPQKSGWLYQLYKANFDATRPAGEWNHLHIRITKAECEINMNGMRYSRFVKGDAKWNRKVAQSKFKRYKNFGKPTEGFICLQDHGNLVAYRNIKIRRLGKSVPNPIDGELNVKVVPAFAQLDWANWEPENERGQRVALRPIIMTFDNDDAKKLYVATQRGVIHAFENKEGAQKSKIVLDIQKKVRYSDRQNEEGLLGFAFHPNYKKNGEVFIYYTTTSEPHTSIISRFTVGESGTASSDSEEVLMKIKQPFWNHNGGTICFGPDGYLYIGLGDGGAANDPMGNGQNLKTLLGSILRIDVNRKSGGKPYAIPADNPFVNKEGARPEIYAYGFRNIWRISFDPKTGALFAADVGQNLWEEINIVKKGGNYGWNRREAAHQFGPKGSGASDELIDPIWEYDHQIGKSITGGAVYRGKKVPELVGKYIYADYITGKIWALDYDQKSKRVVGNFGIASDKLEVINVAQDAQGEVYLMVVAPNGRGIYRFESK